MKKNCPVKGYEDFTIEFPDEFEVGHYEQFIQGMNDAREAGLFNDQSSLSEARFYGCKALCTTFENAPDRPLKNWPLAVFLWFVNTIFHDRLEPALNPPKN